MPRQPFICSEHGEFILYLSFDDEIPKFSLCPHMEEHDHDQCHESPCKYACLQSCAHVIGAVADVYVKRDWNEKANLARCNPTNQMQAQLKSVKNAKEAKEKYGDEREAFR